MKFIDILVRELPNRGGWPDGADAVVQDKDDTEFYFFTGGPVYHNGSSWWFGDNRGASSDWVFFSGVNEVAEDHDSAIITKEQYEAALAASKVPVWDGEGLPPVGSECELYDCEKWSPVKIKFVGDKYVVTDRKDLGYEVVYCLAEKPDRFRPLRTEAERKRHASLYALEKLDIDTNITIRVLDAIAAGKIPGIKLEG